MKMDQRRNGDEKRKKWKRIYERTEIIRGGNENGFNERNGDEKRKKWKRIYERTEIIRGGQ